MDLFPPDVLGGANRSQAAPRTVRVLFEDRFVDTDIVRRKKTFRRRKWLREFFALADVQSGNDVLIERLEPYVFRLSKAEERNQAAANREK
jgi:hypothetical protein